MTRRIQQPVRIRARPSAVTGSGGVNLQAPPKTGSGILLAARGTTVGQGSSSPAVVPGGDVVLRAVVSGWGQEITSTGTIIGPAPLPIFAESVGTTVVGGASPFNTLGYHWDFGYSPAQQTALGNWPQSGRPRWREQGRRPLAAHIYETPGTYTLSCRAQNGAGQYSDRFVTIDVRDPEVWWTTGGRTTVYITSTTGAWPTFANNTRYILTAGADYSAKGTINIPKFAQNIVIAGSIPGGAKPTVSSVSMNVGVPTSSTPLSNILMCDINVATDLQQQNTVNGLTFLRVTVARIMQLVTSYDWYLVNSPTVAPQYSPRNIFVQECVIDRNFYNGGAGYPVNCLTLEGENLAVLGCTIARPVEHGIRCWQGHKSLIAHCSVDGRSVDGSRHAIKHHSTGTNPWSRGPLSYGSSPNYVSRYNLCHSNRLGSPLSNDQWIVGYGPQNYAADERMEDVLVCDNWWQHGTNFYADLFGCARRMTDAGNVRSGGSILEYNDSPHNMTVPLDWQGPYYSDYSTGVGISPAPVLVTPNKAGT